MSTVPTAAEVAEARFREPSDEELLRGFRSEIYVRPSQEVSNSIFFNGQYMTIAAAREAEKRHYLDRARARWR